LPGSVEERVILKVSEASERSSPSKIELSVLIRTLNEADRIATTLTSVVPLGAEIVIVDAGSKDDTVAIARSLGAVVHHNPWPGFGPQRRWGEERCTHDLILSLDADEILTPALVAEIRALFAVPNRPRLMILRKAGIYPHHKEPPPLPFCHEQILIYDRRIARTVLNPNWDKLEIDIDERPHKLKNPVWHYSLRDWNHAVAKINYVAKLAADTTRPRSRAILLVRLLTEFPLTFIKAYVFRRYFLSGADGFIQATIVAFGRFMRIAMMLERKDYGPKE
jgi:glycosyltransferase involved in cell wall biosynthesis